ncbi:hypothetical protein KR018_002988 [Drosophila ironensis]|nr:hypothetical protein KR018_002988 [Drosophila ironensis]
MLHPKLCRVLSVVYYHSLTFALMGTTLRIRSWRKILRLQPVSRTYLVYSWLVGSFLFLNIYLMFPKELTDGYIKYNVVLQWNFVVMIGLRVLAILGCYGTVWLRRKDMILLCQDVLRYWKKYRSIVETEIRRQDLMKLQQSLARLMWRQIVVSYATTFCSSVIQYQLLGVINRYSLIAFAGRISHFLHFVAFKVSVFGGLILLDHQFRVIHLALWSLQKRKVRNKAQILRRIVSMHLETLQLARRIFNLYDIANATLFVNMFMTTVNILYHAVQYSNESIKSDGWGVLFGNGLIFFNTWTTLMLMNMLDRVINSCNDIGQHLRQFSDLPKVGKLLQMELDLFAMQVRRNTLVYKIFGVVKLNKPACLSYIASILSNVIILMQFDLRQTQQPNYDHNYLTHLSRNKTDV